MTLKITIPPFNQLCVYAHSVNGKIVYIGSGSLSRPFELKKRTDVWNAFMNSIADDPSARITIQIVSFHPTAEHAKKAEHVLITNLRPVLNQHHNPNSRLPKLGSSSSPRLVTCVETGEHFASASLAAKKLGVTRGAMSNHLLGRVGFDRVKGFTFVHGIKRIPASDRNPPC